MNMHIPTNLHKAIELAAVIAVLSAATATATATVSLAPSAGAAPPPAFTTLQPRERASLHETLPVQVVLVGYEPDVVPEDRFREYLPGTARPIDRSRTHRAIAQQFDAGWTWATPGVGEIAVANELGLTYSFDHTVVYADDAYEDAFFGCLTSIGRDESDVTGTTSASSSSSTTSSHAGPSTSPTTS